MTTVTIPGGILKVARKLIPKKAVAALQDKGIDVDELINLSMNPEVKGTIVAAKGVKSLSLTLLPISGAKGVKSLSLTLLPI